MTARIAQTTFNRANVVLLALVVAAGALALWLEGYLSRVGLGFALFGLVMGVLAGYFAAFEASTRRLVLLALVAGAGGYLTQWVGATLGDFWRYPPPRGTYYFVPATFAVASLVCFGLTRTVLAPALRRVVKSPSRKLNPLLPLLVLGLLVVLSSPFRGRQGLAFWLYYGAMAAVCVYGALGMNLPTLLAVLGAGALVGTAAEIAGATSGLWTFTTGPSWLPPAWLAIGSWPLEVMTHYTLSGLLAGEALVARPRHFREPHLYRPQRDHPLFCDGRPCRVVCRKGEDKLGLLDAVLEEAGLFAALDRRAAELGRPREALAIAIKPNFMFLYSERDRSTFTDPALVEHLVDGLRARGFRDIAVVEAQSAYGNFFYDREVKNVARVAGYEPRDRYRIVDLTEERVPHRFSGPLGDHFVGPTWRDADFRISFAKNKTHTWAWYTLCLKNVYGALALQNKIREYHYKREIYYPTIDMLVDFPVHFGIVDAWLSADGPFGIFADKEPNPTKTILAGENVVAVDWVGARKMGLDPMVSRYMQLAVQVFGRPQIELVGDATPYSPWRNVPRPVIELWDNAEECYGFTNTLFSVLNRDYVSSAFRRRPMTHVVSTAARLLSPLAGLVFRAPPK
ncbi:MAG TPA: DUF362 domain-containing protein [Anaeromyxobacter sp.]